MIFTNTVNGVDKEMLFHSLSILGIAFFMYLCLFGLSFLSGKLLHLHGDHQQLYSAMSAFGNIGFMGIPIVTSIFPERGMLYISVFTMIDQLMLWTVGVRLTSKAGNTVEKNFRIQSAGGQPESDKKTTVSGRQQQMEHRINIAVSFQKAGKSCYSCHCAGTDFYSYRNPPAGNTEHCIFENRSNGHSSGDDLSWAVYLPA